MKSPKRKLRRLKFKGGFIVAFLIIKFKNMGTKLSWTGLALTVIPSAFRLSAAFVVAGAVILVIGVVLQWLDK